jgi:hypothetical protein
MLLHWGQLRFVPISIPSRHTAPEVWPNRERSLNPSPESPQIVPSSGGDNHSERGFKQYGESCISIRTLPHTDRRLACKLRAVPEKIERRSRNAG